MEPVDQNRAPAAVGQMPSMMLIAGENLDVDVSSYFRDPDGDALTYSATSNNTAVVYISVSGPTLTIAGLADGTATVTVTATDPGGLTATQAVQIAAVSLYAPASARLQRVGSLIVISWDPSPGAAHYTVYHHPFFTDCSLRFGRPTFCDELATNVTDTTYVHTDPSRVFDNHYWVSACAGDDCSELRWAGPPLRPAVRVVERSDNSLTVRLRSRNSDDFEQGLNYFELYRGTSEDGPYGLANPRIDAGEEVIRYVDHGLNSDVAYYYRAKACNGAGCSEQFGTGAGTTEVIGSVEIPPVPTGLGGEEVEVPWAANDARIWWDAMPRATYYEVYQEGKFDATVNAPYTRYYDSDPNDFLGFYATAYSVKACNKAGCSDLSPEFVVR
ncbi:MAG: hypothetical protein OXH46_08135 [Gemmatimonadetes bacterium]|nr:hypothetical protein [Gemmatimonadota bacterium]